MLNMVMKRSFEVHLQFTSATSSHVAYVLLHVEMSGEIVIQFVNVQVIIP